MLKYVETKVAFSEVPDELSLCINLSCCPHSCKGCHYPYLQQDIGEELNEESLKKLIKDNDGITCVSFMGGDNDLPQLHELSKYVKQNYDLKTAWYTGLTIRPQIDRPICTYFDFIKSGPYVEALGPLSSRTTNQTFYARGKHVSPDLNKEMFYDITNRFWNDENQT